MNRRRASVTRNIKAKIGAKIGGAIVDRAINADRIENVLDRVSIARVQERRRRVHRDDMIGDRRAHRIDAMKIDIHDRSSGRSLRSR